MTGKLITILGPTAVGKTKFAALLACDFNGEIISADSRQVYKYMSIGTGKDLQDYFINGNKIKYHLIDIVEPKEDFDLFKFGEMFFKSFELINSRKKNAFLVGGTGLYLSSILQAYKMTPVNFNSRRYEELKNLPSTELKEILHSTKRTLHNTTDLKDKDRLIKAILIAEKDDGTNKLHESRIESLILGINLPRSEIKTRITERLKKRLEAGMIDEVKLLLELGIAFERLIYFGLEYKYIALFLKGELSYNDMYQKLNSAIHDFAKKQMTWFRKMEREGVKINWLSPDDLSKAKDLTAHFLGHKN